MSHSPTALFPQWTSVRAHLSLALRARLSLTWHIDAPLSYSQDKAQSHVAQLCTSLLLLGQGLISRGTAVHLSLTPRARLNLTWHSCAPLSYSQGKAQSHVAQLCTSLLLLGQGSISRGTAVHLSLTPRVRLNLTRHSGAPLSYSQGKAQSHVAQRCTSLLLPGQGSVSRGTAVHFSLNPRARLDNLTWHSGAPLSYSQGKTQSHVAQRCTSLLLLGQGSVSRGTAVHLSLALRAGISLTWHSGAPLSYS